MKKYDSYKDSGIEWIGEIPEHWEVKSFRFCIDVLTDYTANGSFASLAENVTYFERGYSRLVRLTDLRVNLENEGLYVDEHAHNFLSIKFFTLNTFQCFGISPIPSIPESL